MSVNTIGPSDIAAASCAVDEETMGEGRDIACRSFDVGVSLVLIILMAPLLLLIAAAICIDSRGPILFRQRRIGRSQKPFTINKFRTMHDGVGEDVHREFVRGLMSGDLPAQATARPMYKLAADARVTRLGRFLRRTSLDELPQLINVLHGEMSLVGPRPPLPYEVENYPPHWFARFAVRPGVTGLWQVSGRSLLTPEEMIALDAEYVQRRSLWLNLKILLRTIPAVLSTRGAG